MGYLSKLLVALAVVIVGLLTVIVVCAVFIGLLVMAAALATPEVEQLTIMFYVWVIYTQGMITGVVVVFGALAAATLIAWPLWRRLPPVTV